MDYREGVMAERRRAILVAMQATRDRGEPCETGHAVAHKIGQAGDELAIPGEPWNAEYSVFGERRLVLSLPTFLESRESPFTREGRRRMRSLGRSVDVLRKHIGPVAVAGLDMLAERVLQAKALEDNVYELRQEKDKMRIRILDLEETITSLTSQLKGKLG